MSWFRCVFPPGMWCYKTNHLEETSVTHLPPMIVDLAVILSAAAASTLVFSKLKQPVVLGYLIAGFAVGPHFKVWPTVVDKEGVALWAEIGVIFLLFGLGLEFSFKKLAKVGKSAFIAATFEILTMSGLGYLVGMALGWNTMDSIYLGAILSMSSTTIIIRAFGEAGLKGKAFASLVFGILIVEDLMAILLMVILAAISVPGSFSGSNLAYLSTRLAFFLTVWFVVGIYVVPTLLRQVRKLLSDEIMLVLSISLCFLMVVLATQANFSAAIGAFIMGSILSETEEGERIEHLMMSVKDLFAAVFFVSVGMLIDPVILREHFGVVILITVLTIVGKLFGSGFGAVLSGRSLKHSTQAGMSLAQIGEFSFIIATLGVSLKVVSDFLYPIVIAVSAVTTFTTPYMIRYSGPMYDWIERRLPRTFLERLGNYERAMSANGKDNALTLLWKAYGPLVLLNSIIVLAIGLAVAKFGLPKLIATFGDERSVRFITCLATLVLCAPFLYGTVLKAPPKLPAVEASSLLRLSRLHFGAEALRAIIGLNLVAAVIYQFANSVTLPLIVLACVPIPLFLFRKRIGKLYAKFEDQFLQNLNAKEMAEMESLAQMSPLAPWNATLTQMVLSADSPVAGQTLEESQFRLVTGATVVMIDRGSRRIFAPGRTERLLPGDELFLIGTDEQMEAVHGLTQPRPREDALVHDQMYTLESFEVAEQSRFAKKSIKAIGLGEEFGGLIVGIERGGERMLNPESSVTLEQGDLVWVFGHKNKIRELRALSAGG